MDHRLPELPDDESPFLFAHVSSEKPLKGLP
jgi:hypothetical protein